MISGHRRVHVVQFFTADFMESTVSDQSLLKTDFLKEFWSELGWAQNPFHRRLDRNYADPHGGHALRSDRRNLIEDRLNLIDQVLIANRSNVIEIDHV